MFTISEETAGARVDVEVTKRTGFSRSHVAAAIKAGAVSVNGEPVKPSRVLEPGDEVAYAIDAPPEIEVLPETILLDIVFEDDTLLVVNKPAGMVTHPAHGSASGTLVNALLAHVSHLPGETIRAGLVHRLDRDTSGLLVVAKTEAALATLGRAMQKRYISREYRGIVTGVPHDREGTIRGAIGRDPSNRQKYAIRTDGKPSTTHFALRETLHDAAELSFTLETGRTHQIRVHMAAIGHPIFNDPVYGKRDRNTMLPGQALHAWKLAFKHPATKEHLAFQVDPPPAYLETLDTLRG
jgi:23S rRNA pseudouridine1911/1915/1917 synthase